MADATTSPTFVSARGPRPPSQQVVPGVFLLPVASIQMAERLRPVQQAAVDDLKVALDEGVLAHPVTVRPKGEAYELVIGAHRLTAFIQMGRPTIPVIIRDLTDLEARQLEIDENLVRAELNALDRLTFMAERIEVWAARNPRAVVLDASRPIKQRGRPPRNYIKLKQIDGFVPATMGFAAETAQDTGLSPASVYRAVVAWQAFQPNSATVCTVPGSPKTTPLSASWPPSATPPNRLPSSMRCLPAKRRTSRRRAPLRPGRLSSPRPL